MPHRTRLLSFFRLHTRLGSDWRGLLLTLCCVTGELQSVDGYMNIALEKTQEFVNGTKRREYGDAFVRGNNGESTPPCAPASMTR